MLTSNSLSKTPDKLSPAKLQVFFVSVVCCSFISLLLYRAFARQPVWFDEIFFKGIIFGGPLWAYMRYSKKSTAFFGLESRQFWSGAFQGLAIGGLFAFVALVSSAVGNGAVFIPNLFTASRFWSEFGLAFMTAWWESLFFYGLILPILDEQFHNEWISSALTTLLFVLFHAPVLLLRSGFSGALSPLLLLAFFAFGQAILFLRTRSISSVVVSHAFWGMALLVYGSQ